MTLLLKLSLWLGLTTIVVQCQSLRGSNVIVTTVLETPYAMLRESPLSNLTGNDRFEGYIVDLVEEISKILEFQFVLKINDAHMFGMKDKSGKWTGLIGDVVDGRTHIAAAALTITAERENAVDFTIPFMNFGIGILYKKQISEYVPNAFEGLIHPFKSYLTDAFLLLTLVIGIVLLVVRRKHKTVVFRVFLGLWLLVLFIFAALFIAQLSAYYNYIRLSPTTKITSEIASIEDLASQNTIAYGCIKGGSTESFFRNSKTPIHNKIWSRMSSSDPSPLVSNSNEGVERVRNGGYAFFMESTAIEYVTSRSCDLHQVGGLLNSKGYGLAVPQGLPLREELNLAIITLQERGVLAELKNKWWYERRGGGVCVN